MKLTGLKKAVGDYQRANAGGGYSPRYGRLMLDTSDGTIWCDEHYDFGHAEYRHYYSESIINLGRAMGEYNISVNMANVKAFVKKHYGIG